MPKISVWIHLIWSTKNRSRTMTKDLRDAVFRHIRENAGQKDIRLDSIGGAVDHVHVLVRPRPDQSIARIAQMIKGESSHWVNDQKLTRFKFEWQDEYMAVSVSPRDLARVRTYIRNQEEHHRVRSYAEIVNPAVREFNRDDESRNDPQARPSGGATTASRIEGVYNTGG